MSSLYISGLQRQTVRNLPPAVGRKRSFGRLHAFRHETAKHNDTYLLLQSQMSLCLAECRSAVPSSLAFRAHDQSSRNWRFFDHHYMAELGAGANYYVNPMQLIRDRTPTQSLGLSREPGHFYQQSEGDRLSGDVWSGTDLAFQGVHARARTNSYGSYQCVHKSGVGAFPIRHFC